MRKPSSITVISLLIVGLVAAIVAALFVITGMFGLVGTSDSTQVSKVDGAPKVIGPAGRVYGGLDKEILGPRQLAGSYAGTDSPGGETAHNYAYAPTSIENAVKLLPGRIVPPATTPYVIDPATVVGGYVRELSSDKAYAIRSITAIKFTNAVDAQKFVTLIPLSTPGFQSGVETHTTLTAAGVGIPDSTIAYTTPSIQDGIAGPVAWEARFAKGRVAYDIKVVSLDGKDHRRELLGLVKAQNAPT